MLCILFFCPTQAHKHFFSLLSPQALEILSDDCRHGNVLGWEHGVQGFLCMYMLVDVGSRPHLCSLNEDSVCLCE